MATVKIVLRKNVKVGSNGYPIALRLSAKGKNATYIRLSGINCKDVSEWNKDISRFTRRKENYKELNSDLAAVEKRADTLLEYLVLKDKFTFNNYRKLFCSNYVSNVTLINSLELKINSLLSEGRKGTASTFADTLSAIKSIANTAMTIEDVGYAFLKVFEAKRRLKGNRPATIALYLRNLRSLHYEYCKENNKPKPTCYIDFNIARLKEPTKNKALTKDELNKLINYQPINDAQQLAKDIFLFSFYANGINLQDIAKLTQENIVNNRIEFSRSKTKKQYSILINDAMQTILDTNNNSSKYLFPIIIKDAKDDVRAYNRLLNRTLKRIAAKIDINNEISIYYARHSFAQLCRSNGIAIDIISQLLGHSSIETTKAYLNSFSNDTLDNATYNVFNGLNL